MQLKPTSSIHGSRTEPWFGRGNAGQVFAKDKHYYNCKKDLADDLGSELTTLEYKTFWVSVFQSPCKQNSLINEKIATSIFGTKIECY